MRRSYRAGLYAEDRFRRGRRSWRRRALPTLAVALVPLCVVYVTISAFFGGSVWWFGAGLVCGLTVGVGLYAWEAAPWDVLKWGLGAQGERQTEDVLRELEGQGWTVEHDLERDHGNDDHLVVGPNGVYLLETKSLRGRVRVEDGVLSNESPDDPGNVYPWGGLASGLRGRASSVSRKIEADTGVAQWVQGVVVVWGDFAQRTLEVDNVAYVHGTALVDWLRAQRPARVELVVG